MITDSNLAENKNNKKMKGKERKKKKKKQPSKLFLQSVPMISTHGGKGREGEKNLHIFTYTLKYNTDQSGETGCTCGVSCSTAPPPDQKLCTEHACGVTAGKQADVSHSLCNSDLGSQEMTGKGSFVGVALPEGRPPHPRRPGNPRKMKHP